MYTTLSEQQMLISYRYLISTTQVKQKHVLKFQGRFNSLMWKLVNIKESFLEPHLIDKNVAYKCPLLINGRRRTY